MPMFINHKSFPYKVMSIDMTVSYPDSGIICNEAYNRPAASCTTCFILMLLIREHGKNISKLEPSVHNVFVNDVIQFVVVDCIRSFSHKPKWMAMQVPRMLLSG